VHSKKIGTVLRVGLIQRFLFRFINPVAVIGLSRLWVKLFFDKANVATALDTGDPNTGNILELSIQPQILFKIMFGDMIPVHGR
jgi:hypothetical protein